MSEYLRKQIHQSRMQREEEERAWKARMEAQRRESMERRIQQDHFASRAELVKTSVELYALWLMVYLDQGGRKITHSYDYSFYSIGMQTPTISVYSSSYRSNTIHVPQGYGSGSMNLLIFPDITPQIVLKSADGQWKDWGHSQVFTLRKARFGMEADTNQSYLIKSYSDVEDVILRHGTIENLVKHITREGDSLVRMLK